MIHQISIFLYSYLPMSILVLRKLNILKIQIGSDKSVQQVYINVQKVLILVIQMYHLSIITLVNLFIYVLLMDLLIRSQVIMYYLHVHLKKLIFGMSQDNKEVLMKVSEHVLSQVKEIICISLVMDHGNMRVPIILYTEHTILHQILNLQYVIRTQKQMDVLK